MLETHSQANFSGGWPPKIGNLQKKGHWERWIEKYRESGSKNRRSFCGSFGLNYHQFQYWYRKINRPKVSESRKSLIRVKVPATSSVSCEALCQIELRSSHRLWFYDSETVVPLRKIGA